MAAKRAQPKDSREALPVPAELEVRHINRGGESFAVLSFAIREVEVPPNLTEAERQVVDAVLRGCSTSEIAVGRGRAPRTISNQLASIFRKLGVRSRSELVARLSDSNRERRRSVS
jgi:DNA-binding CsgD family transcriptional regulator